MKTKSFILPLLAMLCLILPACNDDATKNDAALAEEIIGRWSLEFESDNTYSGLTYTFNNTKEFIYVTSASTNDDPMPKTMSVRGTWRIYKGVLELTYNLDTFTTTGYTEQEVAGLYSGLTDNNKLVADLKNSGQPYGQEVTFGKSGNTDTMRLSFINGTFMRVSY